MKKRWIYIGLLAVVMIASCLFQQNADVAASGYADAQSGGEIRLVINEVMPENTSTIKDEDGDYSDWIEIYNAGGEAVGLKGYGLSDKHENPMVWTFPDVTVKPGEYLLVWASGKDRVTGPSLHTNFKLSRKEVVTLSNPQNTVVDAMMVPDAFPDVSYGCSSASADRIYLANATPGGLNSPDQKDITPFITHIDPPAFSMASGFYDDAFDLSITNSNPDVIIRYTTDGSEPTAESTAYSGPIGIRSRDGEPNVYSAITETSLNDYPPEKEVFKATVIRAKAFLEDGLSSDTVTHTYFVDKNMAERYKLPVVSLVTDPSNLFDYDYGIYMKGKVYEDWIKLNPGAIVQGDTPANYNQRGSAWERPATIEFFEKDGTEGFQQNVGIRTSGAWSRANRLKSLRIIADSDYDKKGSIDYALFPGLTERGNPAQKLETFKEVLFRSSGNDWEFTLFRDAFMQSLVADLGIDTQAYRPVVVFIDGEFWGIHNIRETFDQYYLKNNYGVDPADSVILEGYSYADGMGVFYGNDGDEKPFRDMIDYVRNNDMSLTENYAYIQTQMDVDNFILYSAAEIFYANTDWPGNNVKIWRKKTAGYVPDAPAGQDGRWRWMLYDTDFGFQLYSGLSDYTHNTVEFATTPNGEPWPNPDWATVLLRSLLTNEEFRTKFLSTFQDLLNGRFQPGYMIKRINDMKSVIEPAMQEHLDRWMTNNDSLQVWKSQISTLVGFAQNRGTYVMRDLRNYFDTAQSKITLGVSDPAGGSIQLNTACPDLSKGIWKGALFNGIPVTVTAVPNEGYTFTGWDGGAASGTGSITLVPDGDIVLNAVFAKK